MCSIQIYWQSINPELISDDWKEIRSEFSLWNFKRLLNSGFRFYQKDIEKHLIHLFNRKYERLDPAVLQVESEIRGTLQTAKPISDIVKMIGDQTSTLWFNRTLILTKIIPIMVLDIMVLTKSRQLLDITMQWDLAISEAWQHLAKTKTLTHGKVFFVAKNEQEITDKIAGQIGSGFVGLPSAQLHLGIKQDPIRKIQEQIRILMNTQDLAYLRSTLTLMNEEMKGLEEQEWVTAKQKELIEELIQTEKDFDAIKAKYIELKQVMAQSPTKDNDTLMREADNKDIMLDWVLPPRFEEDLDWDQGENGLNWERAQSYMNAHCLESRYFHYNVAAYQEILIAGDQSVILQWRRFPADKDQYPKPFRRIFRKDEENVETDPEYCLDNFDSPVDMGDLLSEIVCLIHAFKALPNSQLKKVKADIMKRLEGVCLAMKAHIEGPNKPNPQSFSQFSQPQIPASQTDSMMSSQRIDLVQEGEDIDMLSESPSKKEKKKRKKNKKK